MFNTDRQQNEGTDHGTYLFLHLFWVLFFVGMLCLHVFIFFSFFFFAQYVSLIPFLWGEEGYGWGGVFKGISFLGFSNISNVFKDQLRYMLLQCHWLTNKFNLFLIWSLYISNILEIDSRERERDRATNQEEIMYALDNLPLYLGM